MMIRLRARAQAIYHQYSQSKYSQSTKPTIMQINNAKKYGEFVEITAPVERTASEEFPNVLGGEIWYN